MAAPLAPLEFAELQAPAEWTAIDFISDLHLCESMPCTFDAWATHMRCTDASAVFILGDLFEVWIGDDARHGGFEARCAQVLTDATGRRSVALMHGNRDFLVGDALLEACGIQALRDPSVLVGFGQRILLSHGDALCIADVDYQAFRAQVRSEAWQHDFLSRTMDERRTLARGLREQSQGRKRHAAGDAWVDVDTPTALRWMREAGASTFIHGHTHRPASEALAPGQVREVLSDWDLDHEGPPRAEVLRLDARGLRRIAPINCESRGT